MRFDDDIRMLLDSAWVIIAMPCHALFSRSVGQRYTALSASLLLRRVRPGRAARLPLPSDGRHQYHAVARRSSSPAGYSREQAGTPPIEDIYDACPRPLRLRHTRHMLYSYGLDKISPIGVPTHRFILQDDIRH